MYDSSEGFYITLPNEKGTLFPENTPWEYTTRLPRWIQLDGEWMIGLHSVSYTRHYIVEHFDTPISFTNTNTGSVGKGAKLKKYPTTIREYVANINESLKGSIINKEIEFKLELNGKVTTSVSSGYEVILTRDQAIILGFLNVDAEEEAKEIKATKTGEYQANLHRKTSIFIYCDIVEPQIVGDKTIPLLGIAPCETPGKVYEKIYTGENIRYIPVQTRSFQNIKIHLRSSTYDPMPFEHGRASVTLHLRPLKYF